MSPFAAPEIIRQFLSTPSARRATGADALVTALHNNFYPRPPRGGRLVHLDVVGRRQRFLSTPSARRATTLFRPLLPSSFHFYPRPPRGGRPAASGLYKTTVDISIHALREEGDGCWQAPCWPHQYFYPRPPRGGRPPQVTSAVVVLHISIHALREEGDHFLSFRICINGLFLSTPSARRATARS